jgi:hypothetical protein
MIAQITTRSTDSTDRIVALTAGRSSNTVSFSKKATSRLSQTAHRILNALMRSLATPHI